MNAWEVYDADLGWGMHPVVVVSHPARAHEVVLDAADGLDGPTSASAIAATPCRGRN